MPPQMCVECGLLFNAASPTGPDRHKGFRQPKPRPGNVSLCLNCGHLALYGDDMKLREPTAEENTEPEIIELRRRGKAAATHPYERPENTGMFGMRGGRA
jgi:hypothetical protein